jgi:hypothetical protein
MGVVAENLSNLFKEVYGDKGVPNLIPDGAKLQKEIDFSKKDMIGSKFVQAVRLAYPAGFTHAKGDGSAGAFALSDAVAGAQGRAEIVSAQMVLRDQLGYEDAAKAQSSKTAFVEVSKYLFEGMQKAMRKRLEVQLMYGSAGLGTLSAYSGSSTKIMTITAATWAPGIWAGLEGCAIDIYNGSSKRGDGVIAKVDIENKQITLSADVSGTAAGDVIYFDGAYGNEMVGLHGIMTNTGSLFNIDASTYSLWKATSHAAGGALSFSVVKKAVSKAVGKGLDEELLLLVNPGGWDDILSDIASLRRTDKNEVKKVSIGAEEIEFYSQNGKIRIVPSIYVKEGNAYGIAKPYFKRIGAADVTFNTPAFGDQIFFTLSDNAGVEARAYTHQALFCDAIAKNFVITGIVNS